MLKREGEVASTGKASLERWLEKYKTDNGASIYWRWVRPLTKLDPPGNRDEYAHATLADATKVCFLVHLLYHICMTLTDDEPVPVPWPTVGAQLLVLRRKMMASATHRSTKAALRRELAVANTRSLPPARPDVLTADTFCKVLQMVFDTVPTDAADLATWRAIYASEGLDDAVY